jgi:hypothetical protein
MWDRTNVMQYNAPMIGRSGHVGAIADAVAVVSKQHVAELTSLSSLKQPGRHDYNGSVRTRG